MVRGYRAVGWMLRVPSGLMREIAWSSGVWEESGCADVVDGTLPSG